MRTNANRDRSACEGVVEGEEASNYFRRCSDICGHLVAFYYLF